MSRHLRRLLENIRQAAEDQDLGHLIDLLRAAEAEAERCQSKLRNRVAMTRSYEQLGL